MELNKKTQISAFEMTLATILLFSSIMYFGYYIDEKNIGIHKTQIDSFLDTIYYNEDFRIIIMSEDLSQASLTQNWTTFSTLLNTSFKRYEILISNETVTKTIYSCTEISGKEYTEKIISILDNDNYEFRRITLGVCY